MKKIFLILFIIFRLLCVSAQESKRIETDRPNETEVPYTVPKKYFQIETGLYHEKISELRNFVSHPGSLFKYGVSKRFELRLRIHIATLKEHYTLNEKTLSGIEPLEPGFKLTLWEEKKWIPLTSLLFHTGIPTLASKDFKAKHFAPKIRLAMENDFTDDFSINYNADAEWDGFDKDLTWLYTFSPGIDFGKSWHVFTEVYGFFKKNEAPEHTMDGGVEYFVNKDVALDICSGFGLNKGASN